MLAKVGAQPAGGLMDTKQVVSNRLAEWGMTLSNAELDQLAPAYQKLLRWQGVLEAMLRSRTIAEGINFPESEPIAIHALERTISDGHQNSPSASAKGAAVSEQKSAVMRRTTSHDGELAYMAISDLAPRIQRKELSPVELGKAILSRVESLNPRLNAYYTIFGDELMSAARAAESDIVRGEYRGPLHGIPVGIKDIYEYGRTTCGSKPLEDYVARGQATSVSKLIENGALIVGKTATYEFAFGFPTNKSYFKPTRNPWNLAYDAGGSSSGTASSVAAGLAYVGMGSCTGGSIRWPAQCCNIVGLKPSYGRVSRAGVYPLAWSLDHTGPLARTVTDAALMLQACAGYDPSDPASANLPVPEFTAQLGQDVKGMRVGLPRSLYDESCDPKVREPYEAAIKQFERLGAELIELPSIKLAQAQAIAWPAIFAETAAIHADNVRPRGQDYNPHAKLYVAFGLLVSGACYLLASRVRAQVRDDLLRQLQTEVDVLMLPTSGTQVPRVPEDSPGLSIISEEFPIYTPIFNFTGLPAIQVPCGFDADGLPVGFQIAGKSFDEATVCKVAFAYEQSTPWHTQHPKL
jgi:aspartyl-tRNA(Asn)/glutamyl-tRNA(Gln) amidotransferase subunit A